MNWLAVGYLAAALVAMQAGYALARDGLAEAVSRMMAGALLIGGVFAVGTQIAAVPPRVGAPFVDIQRRGRSSVRQHGAGEPSGQLHRVRARGRAVPVQTRRLAAWAWLVLSIVLSAGLALTVSRAAVAGSR